MASESCKCHSPSLASGSFRRPVMASLAPCFFATDHAVIRCRQRAISRQMLQAVLAFGSERRDGIFMTRRDCVELVRALSADLRVRLLHGRKFRSLGRARFAKSTRASRQSEIRALKRLISVLQRCEGIYVPTDGRTIITAQRLGPAKRRGIFLKKRKPRRQFSREDLSSPPHTRHHPAIVKARHSALVSRPR